MNWTQQEEIYDIVKRIGPVVLSTVPVTQTTTFAALRRCVGMMMSDVNMIHIETFAVAMRIALDLARLAGATLASMGKVRLAALAEDPQSLGAIETVQTIIRLSLAQEARLVTAITFISRDDAATVAMEMGAAFDQAAEVASDDLDAASYMAIINLQSTLTKYLSDVGRMLPRHIPYSLPVSVPALTMSQTYYGDGAHAQELADENKVINPAFMPMSGRMLAY